MPNQTGDRAFAALTSGSREFMTSQLRAKALLFDHDAVDGSTAARFTDALVRNIENATEL